MMAKYNDLQVFIAFYESAVDGHTGQRGYGHSQVGKPCGKEPAFYGGSAIPFFQH
jgi:hypothetical protein